MRSYAAQKAGLTRAIKTKDTDKLVAECKRTVSEWNTLKYGWPDDWARWQRALDDQFPIFNSISLDSL